MEELPIPDAATRDSNSVEMLRAWIADNGLHCAINIGMYVETSEIAEEAAWGTILADVARHVADGLNRRYDRSKHDALRKIEQRFIKELRAPTSPAEGGFM
jgi:hypothetical protein